MHSPDLQPSDASVPNPDRRQHPRYPLRIPIELREDNSDVPVRTETTDLSLGGCYVQLTLTLQVGIYINATFWLNDSPVRVRGRVVTRHPEFGNGIMFLEFKESGDQLLARYLEAVPAS